MGEIAPRRGKRGNSQHWSPRQVNQVRRNEHRSPRWMCRQRQQLRRLPRAGYEGPYWVEARQGWNRDWIWQPEASKPAVGRAETMRPRSSDWGHRHLRWSCGEQRVGQCETLCCLEKRLHSRKELCSSGGLGREQVCQSRKQEQLQRKANSED